VTRAAQLGARRIKIRRPGRSALCRYHGQLRRPVLQHRPTPGA